MELISLKDLPELLYVIVCTKAPPSHLLVQVKAHRQMR
nr:hypothetical protein [Escherichia coli]